MKLKIVSLAMLVLVSAMFLAGCSNSSDKEKSGAVSANDSSEEAAIPASGAKPVLSIADVQGKPGETVNVEVSISGADGKWANCGVHFSYDEKLECELEEDGKFVVFKKGPAVEKLTDLIAAIWTENRTEEMKKNNQYSLFLAGIATGDRGKDGVIATFRFRIPDDAEAGTVYPLEFFEQPGDMFTDTAMDAALQSYAFSHWKHGSITVV